MSEMEDTKFIDCECTGPNIDSFSVSIGDIRFVPSPPPDVVEAARRLEKLNYLMAFVPLADAGSVRAVCDWIIQQAAPGKP